ncbi:dienelactone hydrolase family protein [Solihabitans fulvus]|uniref:dienelactone hydrolase family protein n=1 Tax=Solihabitans fulvus TaxID=1892852 RepID=UPI001CB76433|nr:dienelactone hydrolase family protein [Solihabitans fulvus]
MAEHGPIELTAADGNRCNAYRAKPATPNGRNVVLLPDVRGLHPFYEDLAVRFAEAGFDTVAFDYFGRSAGTGPRGEGFDWQQHWPKVTPDQVHTDASAAAGALGDGPTYTVGFCFGGSQSWRLAASDLDLAGAIGFYGKPKLVADVVESIRVPLLLLVAGADQATPQADFAAFDQRLTDLGKPHELHVYDGAPHSFFDRAHGEWRDACADAWRRILDFTTG